MAKMPAGLAQYQFKKKGESAAASKKGEKKSKRGKKLPPWLKK